MFYLFYLAIWLSPGELITAFGIQILLALPMKIFTTIFFISSIVHGIQGLKDVEDDYFTERTLGFMSKTLGSYALFFRVIFRFFIALVVLVLTYILVFEYLLGG